MIDGRSLFRLLGDKVNGRRRIRVVVLGSTGCGKTVFLTSLASHLLNHDKKVFDLNGWEVFKDAKPQSDKGLKAFPYEDYRDGFTKSPPVFPEGTVEEMSVLKLPLRLKKAGEEHSVLLELLDLPGERVSDLVMAHKSYYEWCEWMQTAFAQVKKHPSFCAYLEKAKQAKSAAGLFKAYKEHLLAEYDRYSLWITPSIVKLVDKSAVHFKEEIDGRLLGIDADSQFVPLPVEAFESGHALHGYVKDFEAGYRKYRKAIVEPVADWLSEANQLVYLVDVPGILKKGIAAYDAEFAFGTDVIGMFRKRRRGGLLRRLVDFFCGLFTTEIQCAYLVATKADVVFKQCRENLGNLADQILGKAMSDLGLDLPENSTQSCAAVIAVAKKDGKTLARQDAASNEEKEYHQIVVPEEWPSSEEEWDTQYYYFEDVFPRFSELPNAVPPQSGLDDLAAGILGISRRDHGIRK